MIDLEKEIKFIAKHGLSACWWPKVTLEQIEELEQYLLQRRREIEHEEMCF